MIVGNPTLVDLPQQVEYHVMAFLSLCLATYLCDGQ